MLGYGAYLVFFEFCKKAFPEISDQTVARMVAGIDVFMFRPDEELKKLARLAVDLKVDGKFGDGSKPADTLAALGQMGEPGKAWLDALEETRDPWFLMSTGDGFYHHTAAGMTTSPSRSRRSRVISTCSRPDNRSGGRPRD
jgi:pyruvate,water dikinase